MATGSEFQLRARVASVWDHLIRELRVLSGRVVVTPDNGYEVFKPSTQESLLGSMRLDVCPLALRVPERASDIQSNLYIAVSGFLYYDQAVFQQQKELRTTKFGTQVAYFRRVGDRYDHVLGAHFDFSEDLGHPAFHAQFKSQIEMFPIVMENLGVTGEAKNCLTNVLTSARVPSAQLDVFSLMLHIFADRLIWRDSNDEERGAFSALLSLSSSVQGAGHYFPRFRNGVVQECMSSRHWYPT
jgi:hypothetical protein